MKTLILIFVLMANAFAADKKVQRKVSNSVYFVCQLEREASDSKSFKKEYHFPFPTEKGEVYELKGSMRWNEFSIVFSQSGAVKIRISEGKASASKTHQLGKEPQFDSMKVQVDVKTDDGVIPYTVQCNPE